jgi:coenzyme F420 hydrogenase subunit beta
MEVFGPNELVEDVLKRDFCIGCGACVNLCPYFKSYRGKTAMLFPCTLSQGQCFAYCPKVEMDLDALSSKLLGQPYDGSDLGRVQEVLASQAGDKAERGPFQAGGTVSALVSFALRTGRIDAAVLTDREGLIPVPRLVTEPEEVLKCASSKFTAAPTLAVLNQGRRDGYSRMGVVGTPCQVMGVAQMRLNPLDKEGFQDAVGLVVGLFCTWAVDTRKLSSLLSERLDASGIRKMDMPPPPSELLVIDTGQGKVEIPLDEIRPLVPAGCQICPDMTSEWADVSVGVLEGKPAWNTLIIRTERGRELVEEARKEGLLVTEAMPEKTLRQLRTASVSKKKKALARARDRRVLNTNDDSSRSALRIRDEILQKILD